jgi:mRNA-degrading endonuclease toxin of MazEF toxin-antitoxin module
VALPDPHPGLVISYCYLWQDENAQGQEEGTKNRPCAIVLTRQVAADVTIVSVLPITHTSPKDPEAAIELPPGLKAHLGLDEMR